MWWLDRSIMGREVDSDKTPQSAPFLAYSPSRQLLLAPNGSLRTLRLGVLEKVLLLESFLGLLGHFDGFDGWEEIQASVLEMTFADRQTQSARNFAAFQKTSEGYMWHLFDPEACLGPRTSWFRIRVRSISIEYCLHSKYTG